MKWDSFSSQPCWYILFCVLSSMAEWTVGAISVYTPCRGTSMLWLDLKVIILQPWAVKFLQLWWLLELGRAEPLKLASTKAVTCCMGNYPLFLADLVPLWAVPSPLPGGSVCWSFFSQLAVSVGCVPSRGRRLVWMPSSWRGMKFVSAPLPSVWEENKLSISISASSTCQCKPPVKGIRNKTWWWWQL